MAKVDLGTKRICPECDAKFYDLARNPAICPMCQNSFDPSELDEKPVIPAAPLKPQKSTEEEDDGEEKAAAAEIDEEDIDEEEEQAKELELDGDDIAVIGGATGDDGDQPGYDGYSADEDEDEDAALVVDEDNELPPPDADDTDDDDVEEVEI